MANGPQSPNEEDGTKGQRPVSYGKPVKRKPSQNRDDASRKSMDPQTQTQNNNLKLDASRQSPQVETPPSEKTPPSGKTDAPNESIKHQIGKNFTREKGLR